MKCPVCDDVDLAIADRQGVEIDYCPRCRGIWLDRGELDKLIDRAEQERPAPPRSTARGSAADERRSERPGGDPENDHEGGRGKRRRGSLLAELFDFD